MFLQQLLRGCTTVRFSFYAHGSGDNYVLIVGDFSAYCIADRISMSVEMVPHIFGANQRPTGQSGFYAYYRVGADVVGADASLALLNVT
jgi:HK97 family phage major capsid protein